VNGAGWLAAVRAQRPLVHQIVGPVTAHVAAAAVAAIGGRPVMAEDPEDAEAMAASADALVCSLGMPRPHRLEAMRRGCAALRAGAPRVLDPVGAGGSAVRTAMARGLMGACRFTILRGNGAEVGALAGSGGRVRGVDAADEPDDVEAACRALAAREGLVVAATGAVDRVAAPDGRLARIHNGDALAGRVVGAGCMATAVVGAFAAAGDEPWEATVWALVAYGVACERAAAAAGGPGTFLSLLWDALAALRPEEADAAARVEVLT
jgi:hydroxyethylthiazole kinase